MASLIKKIIKSLAAGTGILLLLALLYLGAAGILTLIPVNASYKAPGEGITIYVQTNGVHTDFTLPVKHSLKDWTQQIDPRLFTKQPLNFNYVSFGWGDRGFYLETPTWADLEASVAVNALFLPSATAMHVTYETSAPSSDYSRRLIISESQYAALIDFIEASFVKDHVGNFRLIEGYSYTGYYNNFYEAKGYYHLFHTSNNWTNQGVKKIGVKTATWAPFDWCVLYHL